MENHHDTWNTDQHLCVFVRNQVTLANKSCAQRSGAFNLILIFGYVTFVAPFCAHLFNCTVGSYAPLSVYPSLYLSIDKMYSYILSHLTVLTWVKVNGHIVQGQIRVQNICRWAHINSKLLHQL